MMALQLLPILQVIVILCSPTISGVPIYGTKRYGRSTILPRPVWNSQPYQQTLVRNQRYPMNYYDMYPYGQSYLDDYYYPQEAYPIYYPARTSKYEVYQAVMPYYYDRPIVRPNYYYGYGDNTEPVVDLEEEMLQEAEREEREEAQPIGQEMYYENEPSNDDNLDDVNAAFLQNLIMTQMYNDAMADRVDSTQKSRDNYRDRDDVYGKWEEYPIDDNREYYQEDEDVKELKNLASKSEKFTDEERRHWFDKGTHPSQSARRTNNWETKRDTSPKKMGKIAKEQKEVNSIAATTESTGRKEARGQKEEVLLRPAVPIRRPFSSQVLSMMSKNDEDRKRTPSVYDTIKHMLDMEKSLENKYENIKPSMRKRIISSEDSLTQQLSVLKKAQ